MGTKVTHETQFVFTHPGDSTGPGDQGGSDGAVNLSDIPATTWEQFGLAILIMAFVVFLADRVLRFMVIVKKIMDDTNLSFQQFLAEQRKQDHLEQQEREAAFSLRNSRLAEMLDKVAERIERLAVSQENHNIEMREAVNRMEQKTQPKSRLPKG